MIANPGYCSLSWHRGYRRRRPHQSVHDHRFRRRDLRRKGLLPGFPRLLYWPRECRRSLPRRGFHQSCQLACFLLDYRRPGCRIGRHITLYSPFGPADAKLQGECQKNRLWRSPAFHYWHHFPLASNQWRGRIFPLGIPHGDHHAYSWLSFTFTIHRVGVEDSEVAYDTK